MKYFIVLLVLVACAFALPAQILSNYDTEIDWAQEAQLAANETSARTDRATGFASFGSGTRGGAGGAVWTVWDAWALRDAVTGDAPRVVYVRGRIDLSVLFVHSPGVVVNVGSWKSIIGGDSNAEIHTGGLRISRAQQVIIQNIKFYNALSFAHGEQPNGNGGIINQVTGVFTEVDAVLCEQAEHVWIDHNEFADDPWIADNIPTERMRHDGLVDIKRASNWITVSHNIFRNHNKVMLIGHSDRNAEQDAGKLKTTIVKNWFIGTTQRNPRVRFGEVHVLNNLYTDIGSYCIGVGAGSSIYAERNVFINSRAWRPISTNIGNLYHLNNQFKNSNWDPVPNQVNWSPSNYYDYSPLGVNLVEAEIRRIAGTW